MFIMKKDTNYVKLCGIFQVLTAIIMFITGKGIGIAFYITMLGTLLLIPNGDEFVATIAFWPLVLAALLQNVIYIGESELTTFNKKILMRDIQKVKIEKSILWTYIVSIYNDISKSPKAINISKRYIHAFYKELNLKNIKIELKGFDVEGI